MGYNQGFPLDFTFDEVRDFVFEVMREVVSRFDVDGIEMTFRDPGYYPQSLQVLHELRDPARVAAGDRRYLFDPRPLAPGLFGLPNPRLLDKHPGTPWFPVPPEAMAHGDNRLEMTLTKGDPDAGGDIVIDEVEVWVQPK